MLAIGMAIALSHVSLGLRPIAIHGAAEWIMRDPAIAWCCGPKECSVVPAGGVVQDGRGWRIPDTGQHFEVGDLHTYWSRDQRMWWCRIDGSDGRPMHGDVKCLFVPKPGS